MELSMQANFELRCWGERVRGQSMPSDMNGSLITVITPVLNGAKELESAILSVLRQKCDQVEYIIVDGDRRMGHSIFFASMKTLLITGSAGRTKGYTMQ